MTAAELKRAEELGYKRGYAVGRKTGARIRTSERLLREKQALLDRIYLAVLSGVLAAPPAVDAKGRPVDPIALAEDLAVRAYRRRPVA